MVYGKTYVMKYIIVRTSEYILRHMFYLGSNETTKRNYCYTIDSLQCYIKYFSFNGTQKIRVITHINLVIDTSYVKHLHLF